MNTSNASPSKNGGRGGKVDQIFGTQSRQRENIAVAISRLLVIIITCCTVYLSVGVLKENGPDGRAVVKSVLGTTTGPSLFDFSKGAALTESVASDQDAPNFEGGTYKPQSCELRSSKPATGFSKVYAYARQDLQWMSTSLVEACPSIDVLMPDWFELDSKGFRWSDEAGNPDVYPDHPFAIADGLAHLPVVAIESIDEDFIQRLSSPSGNDEVLTPMRKVVEKLDVLGLCLDLHKLNADALLRAQPLIQNVHDMLASSRRESCIIVNAAMLKRMDSRLLQITDKVVVNIFRQDIETQSPTPIASDSWVLQSLKDATNAISKDRLVALFGAGGREWRSGRFGSKAIDYATAMQSLEENSGRIRFAATPKNSFIAFFDRGGVRHNIWLLDAASTYNQLRAARALRLENVGIWGLGSEDPSIWPLFNEPDLSSEITGDVLSVVNLQNHVRYVGDGRLFDFTSNGRAGKRIFEFSPETDDIVDVTYLTYPVPYSVRRWGAEDKKIIALTFDDGPDPKYTDRILDILRDLDAPATFFPVGKQMVTQDKTITRMFTEGHLVGSHTMFHEHLEQVSDSRLRMEMNLQSRIFKAMTGRKPVLFRAPYVDGFGPVNGAIAHKMAMIDSLGYIVAGSDIVAPDWKNETPKQLADYVVESALLGKGNIVLLHDGGGDRSATIKALPDIITRLRKAGFTFADLSEIANVPHAELIPVDAKNPMWIEIAALSVTKFSTLFLKYLFWGIVAIGLTRAVVVLTLASKRGRHAAKSPGFAPDVTVLVPAYNEEKVIARTIDSILSSTYSKIKVVVVNDGSTDNTKHVVEARYGNDPRVELINQRNGGKWMAANAAFKRSLDEIVVAIDADTLVDPQAIEFIVQKMSNPRVGAVAGNVKVGNERNILTKLQALEYITAQNIDRRAFELLKGIMVVPGAIGAWRVAAVRDAGYYSADTMTEDADLTLSVLRAGYEVVYDERAYTYTEAPENIRDFLAQRLRWTLGMMQTSWKHKSAIKEGRTIGFVTLPDLFVFGVLFPVLSPLVDLILINAVVGSITDLARGQPVSASGVSLILIAGYMALPLLEAYVAARAIRFDPRASLRLLFYLPLQRLFYRQLLTITVYRALWRAISGRLANWRKLKRTASVVVWFGGKPVRQEVDRVKF